MNRVSSTMKPASRFLTFWFLAITCSISAQAQSPSPDANYRTVEAAGTKPLQLGYHGSAQKDCSRGPLPNIKVSQTPNQGVLRVRRGKLTTNKVVACPGLQVPVQIVFYQAREGASGSDRVVYEVAGQTGNVRRYDITINIKPVSRPAAIEKQEKI